MKKKGFTLVELLAVIAIISLLTLVIGIAVTNTLKSSKNKISITQKELIKSGAQTWGADNLKLLPKAGECKYLLLEDLKDYGVLPNSIIDSNNNGEIPNDLQIKITNTIGKYGNEIINYEVEPLSIDGCSHISD